MQSISLPEFVNGENVGMIQGRRRMRFLLETTQPALITSQFRGKHLERNFALEPHVLGQINLAHASGAEHGNYFVVRQLSAGGNGSS